MKKKWTKDNRVVIFFGAGGGVSSLHAECETVNFVLYIFFCSSPNKNHLEKEKKKAACLSFEGDTHRFIGSNSKTTFYSVEK